MSLTLSAAAVRTLSAQDADGKKEPAMPGIHFMAHGIGRCITTHK